MDGGTAEAALQGRGVVKTSAEHVMPDENDSPRLAHARPLASVLTWAVIKNLKPGRKRRYIRDGGSRGLYLIIHPSGRKNWFMRFRRPDGRAGKLTLGPVDLVSDKESDGEPIIGQPLRLVAARRLAAEINRQRAFGHDVVAEITAEKARQRSALAEKANGKAARLAVIDLKYVLDQNSLASEERSGAIDLVYFIKIGGVVKIGHTIRIEQRLRDLRGATSEKVTLLACFPGGERLEKQIHRHLEFARIPKTKEFFEYAAASDFVASIAEFASNASLRVRTDGVPSPNSDLQVSDAPPHRD
jgi:Arm DNA-binding domain/Meiotically up-regulated gene 113